MKKQFLSYVCIGLAFALLCGCGTSKDSTDDVSLTEPVEIPVHQLYFDVDFEGNWFFSTYDVELYLDKDKIGTLPHGKHYTSLAEVEEGTHAVTFYKKDDPDISSSEEVNVTNDMTFQCHIQTHSDSIDVDEITILDSVSGSSITMPDVTGSVLSDACNELKENGFINIDYHPDDDTFVWDEDDWIVTAQNIEAGKEIDKNEAIVLTCHKAEDSNAETSEDDHGLGGNAEDTSTENDSESSQSYTSADEEGESNSVDYSTNDKSTVENGNSGVYAYKSRGGSYDNYYVIDFDEGYVYYFTDGNGNDGDRIKIESGDLNDVVIITYHDGEDEWSEGLHFKWKNRPDHLIMQDHNGFEYDFYSTNLNDALALRNSKNFTDY